MPGMWLVLSRSRFLLVDCGPVEFEQSRRSYGACLCKYLGSARVNECNGAVWPFDARAIYRHNAGTTDALASPLATSILPIPTTGNNANRGRNLWKDKPLERSVRVTHAKRSGVVEPGKCILVLSMKNVNTCK
ncbi:hypothetical protein AVEN_87916-1 [Araneus ventricosus]|uniref:Uncharacterized protein n=1 Tax=Araneus ventricosus TaxID=182803 RepID=A0A4Y2BC29_ARAVE|nr:hypothetical protein AVEN_87916-1 [Araneus ventricosus]